MDGLSAAVNVATAIELSVRIVALCWEYFNKVKSARKDIELLRVEVLTFQDAAQKLDALIKGPQGSKLDIGDAVASSIRKCSDDLKNLDERLQTGKVRKFGITALKWPFTSNEIEKTITVLKRHELSFNTVLNLNQMNVVLKVDDKINRMDQERYLGMLPYSSNASYNSYFWQHEPLCHHETRVGLLNEIRDWTDDVDGKPVYWLSGLAGTGKSTVSRTLCRQLHEAGLPIGSYFFSRGGGELSKAEKLWSTLAHSMAKTSPLLLTYISEVVSNTSDIGYRGLKEQWKQLIYEPLSKANENQKERLNFIFVIDALDECESQDDIGIILELLSLVRDFKTVRLRVFLTSRPETHIRMGFHKMPHIVYRNLILHNVDRSIVSHDIRVYLQDELDKIKVQRQISNAWPGQQSIDLLVERADCLFIYAATACRYVGEASRVSPQKRLKNLLEGTSSGLRAEKSLDVMYLKILTDSLSGDYSSEELTEITSIYKIVVGAIVLLREPLSIDDLSNLLKHYFKQYLSEDDSIDELVANTIDPFASLLNIPSSRTLPIRILHPSFRDFLTNRCSADEFKVNAAKTNANLCQACIQIINDELESDFFDVKDHLGILQKEIEGNSVRQALPLHIQYACRYWILHLIDSDSNISAVPAIPILFEKNLLRWLEVVLLLGQIGDILKDLSVLYSQQKKYSSENDAFIFSATKSGQKVETDWDSVLLDLLTFLKTHRGMLEYAPYQLYGSALLQSPTDSIIRRLYQDALPKWIATPPIMEKTWSASVQSFEAHTEEILDLALSLDGKYAVSGSKDGSVKIWNLVEGALETSLIGHKAAVQSVAISPKADIAASASKDCTARVWSVKTGACLHVMDSHTDVVQKVAISAHRNVLATGSQDGEVHLHDVSSGTFVARLAAQAGGVTDLAYSSSGEHLAVGYYDGAVCLWSALNNSLLFKLESHKSAVNTVLFSQGPRGLVVASGSYDRTVKLWSISTGELLTTLADHTRLVKSISFSSHGTRLASASFDNTIKVWDVESGKVLNSLKGHKDALICVAFSPSSEEILASGAKDRTVQVWKTNQTTPVATLKGHSRTVNAISWLKQVGGADLLASASRDCTIRIWEPFSSREYDTTVPSHSDAVRGIEISPDGLLIATWSKDKAVKLWDSSSGELLHSYDQHADWVSTVVFSPDSRMIASGGHDNQVNLYRIDGHTKANMSGHAKTITFLRFSPDNEKLASCAYDTVIIWNLNGEILGSCNTHTRRLNAMSFSPDSNRLVSGSYDSTVAVYNISLRSMEFTLKGHIRSVDSVCFSSNGSMIASGSKDQTAKIWSSVDGKLVTTLRGHNGPIACQLFSSDDRYLISRAGEEVKVWDTASGRLLNTQHNISPFVLDSATSTSWLSEDCINVKQVAPGQSEHQIEYRYVKKVLRLVLSGSGRHGVDVPEVHFQAESNAVGVNVENHFTMTANLQWITRDGENVLFLPGHLRPRNLAVYRQNVVIGNGSGRVLVHGFDHSRS